MPKAYVIKCISCGDSMAIEAQLDESQRKGLSDVQIQKLNLRAAKYTAKKLGGMCLECALGSKIKLPEGGLNANV